MLTRSNNGDERLINSNVLLLINCFAFAYFLGGKMQIYNLYINKPGIFKEEYFLSWLYTVFKVLVYQCGLERGYTRLTLDLKLCKIF